MAAPKNPKRYHIDITGKRFGKLTVLERIPGDLKHIKYLCKCDCGKTKKIQASNITSGKSRTCGCGIIEAAKRGNSTHKMSKSFEYTTWQKMRYRCTNPNNKDFHNYGARGIRVCDRWRSFENFYADMGKAPPGHSIDRIDNNGNYEPSNCRWATKLQQARNTRRNKLITAYGHTMRPHEWEDITGIPADTIVDRLLKGWTDHRAVTKPLRVMRMTPQSR